jgi:hypothetical protein
MIKKILTILFIFCLALPVCAKKRQQEDIITPMEQLEKREYQTRAYVTADKTMVMKAILNTLQDEGYIVYNANPLLGFIYGSKDFDTSDSNVDISKEFGLSKSRLSMNGIKVATIDASVNVTQFDDNIRVRVNFKRKLLNTYGNAQFIDDVSEEEFYTDFYKKVDQSLYLLKQKI